MSHIYITLQIIISLYCVDVMLQWDKGEFLSFLVIGIHLILYLLGVINERKGIKKKIYTLDMAWIIGSMLLGWPELGIVAVLLCAEYALLDKQKKELGVFIGLVSIASLISIEKVKWMWGGYLVIGVLGWFIYKNEKKVVYLTNYNQTLKEESIKLQQRIEEIAKEKSQIEYLTKVNERNLLAQRLHDKIGHTLAGNIMQLEV
ncbi:MAG: histidine kinase dimerization/phosphoacceptor domain-containing protein, partial [Cellulosilyticaceae bacterium]